MLAQAHDNNVWAWTVVLKTKKTQIGLENNYVKCMDENCGIGDGRGRSKNYYGCGIGRGGSPSWLLQHELFLTPKFKKKKNNYPQHSE